MTTSWHIIVVIRNLCESCLWKMWCFWRTELPWIWFAADWSNHAILLWNSDSFLFHPLLIRMRVHLFQAREKCSCLLSSVKNSDHIAMSTWTFEIFDIIVGIEYSSQHRLWLRMCGECFSYVNLKNIPFDDRSEKQNSTNRFIPIVREFSAQLELAASTSGFSCPEITICWELLKLFCTRSSFLFTLLAAMQVSRIRENCSKNVRRSRTLWV